MKIKVAILLLVGLWPTFAKAREMAGDSVRKTFAISPDKMALGGGLVIAGSLLNFDHGGRQLGGMYPSAFSCKADEVLRFVPAVALVGMKAFGIESRTEKWSELIVRSAASTAIMGLTAEGTKRIVGRVRPDGSDDRSFPSGHSAAAFLTASLFAKEYGHLSPWYSVGAYSVATTTAMLRRVNNQHWMSDVMVGAGIGILSVELGYAVTDLFYGAKGHKRQTTDDKRQATSMAGVYMNYVFPHAIEGTTGGQRIRSRLGYATGMEVAHYFHPSIGVGGRMGITCSQMEVDGQVMENPLDQIHIMAGPHFRTPPAGRFSFDAHLHGGYGLYQYAEIPMPILETCRIGGDSGWGYEGGIAVSYFTHKGITLNLTGNYQSWSNPSPGMENKGFSVGLSAMWGWR